MEFEHGPYDRFFRSDRGWLLKTAGAGALGLAIAARTAWEMRLRASLAEQIAVLVTIPTFFALAAALLVRADVVWHKLRAGFLPGPVLRLLFGAGIWSVLAWVVLVLFVGLPLAIVVGNLTADHPPG